MSDTVHRQKLFGSCLIILAYVLLAAPPAGHGAELDLRKMFREGIPPSPFSGAFYRYADAMLQHGRDSYGPEKTGLLLTALDRKTLSPLKTRPAAPHGADELPAGPGGGPLVVASPPIDQNVLRLLYFLVGLSGEDRYGQAADEGLRAFLKHPAWEDAPRMPWSKHAFWNVITDEVAWSAETDTHEFFGPWVLWDTCFRLAPEESRRIAARMRKIALPDQPASAASGEGDSRGGPHPPISSPRQQGFLIRTWAEAYAHTGERTFLSAIEVLLNRAQDRSQAAGKPMESGAARGEVGSLLSMAIDCDGAARKVPNPLRTRLTNFAATQDRIFCSLSHDLKLWKQRLGKPTAAAIAMMCVSRYENTGKVAYRELIVAAADAYLDSLPGDQTDAWPLTFGQVISLELAAFRIAAEKKYHERAFEVGEVAMKTFLGDSPLPRASTKTDHYESTTGAGTLMLALVELHLSTLGITAVRAPANTIDR